MADGLLPAWPHVGEPHVSFLYHNETELLHTRLNQQKKLQSISARTPGKMLLLQAAKDLQSIKEAYEDGIQTLHYLHPHDPNAMTCKEKALAHLLTGLKQHVLLQKYVHLAVDLTSGHALKYLKWLEQDGIGCINNLEEALRRFDSIYSQSSADAALADLAVADFDDGLLVETASKPPPTIPQCRCKRSKSQHRNTVKKGCLAPMENGMVSPSSSDEDRDRFPADGIKSDGSEQRLTAEVLTAATASSNAAVDLLDDDIKIEDDGSINGLTKKGLHQRSNDGFPSGKSPPDDSVGQAGTFDVEPVVKLEHYDFDTLELNGGELKKSSSFFEEDNDDNNDIEGDNYDSDPTFQGDDDDSNKLLLKEEDDDNGVEDDDDSEGRLRFSKKRRRPRTNRKREQSAKANSLAREELKCRFCEKTFTKKIRLEVHMRSHTGERPYICEICSMAFTEKGTLKRHQYTHTGNAPKKYKCDVCDKRYSHYNNLKEHKTVHTGEALYMCTQCGKDFRFYSNFLKHMKGHASSVGAPTPKAKQQARPAKTSKPGIKSDNGGNSGGGETFECKLCNKTYINQGALLNHERKHGTDGPEGEKPVHKCEVCGKVLSNKYILKFHMRTHTGDLPFECETCGKRFNSKANMERHTLAHVEQKNFQCDVCGKWFAGQFYLDAHKIVHTDQKFPCDVCHRVFNTKTPMYKHRKTHFKE